MVQGGVLRDVQANLATLERMCELLAETHRRSPEADTPLVVVFQELFLQGYDAGEDLVRLAEPCAGAAFQRVRELAMRLRVGIVYGYAELDVRGRIKRDVYNSMAFVSDQGERVVNYRKVHLFGAYERRYFKPGPPFRAPVLYKGIRIGALICWDTEFPEPSRVLRLHGAELILSLGANTAPFVNDVVIPTRAFENHVFYVYVNCAGKQESNTFCGKSVIVAPDGSKLLQLSTDNDDSGIATLEFDKPEYRRHIERNPVFRYRVPAYYVSIADRILHAKM